MSEEQKQENSEVLTQVTSIVEEEKKTGKKIELPSPEVLAAKASASLLSHRRLIEPVFGSLSKKATIRTLMAIFDLPQEGLPIRLVTEEERQAYQVGRTMVYDLFLIMQHHIHQKRKEIAEQVVTDQQGLNEELNAQPKENINEQKEV